MNHYLFLFSLAFLLGVILGLKDISFKSPTFWLIVIPSSIIVSLLTNLLFPL